MTPNHKPDPADKPAKPQAKRRWYQFSLWSMFVWVTVIGVVLMVGLKWIAPEHRHWAAVGMVKRLGGIVGFADSPTDQGRMETWFRRWLSRDYFDAVEWVELTGSSIADADLQSLNGLSQLERLWLNSTTVTDAGLVHLSCLTQLEQLYIIDTKVTDAGLAELRRSLPNCQVYH